MKIENMGSIVSGFNLPDSTKTQAGSSVSFSDYLNNTLNELEKLENEAQDKAKTLITGDTESLHQTMIAYQKAFMALQLTIEVRDKLVSAYQELMRIQM